MVVGYLCLLVWGLVLIALCCLVGVLGFGVDWLCVLDFFDLVCFELGFGCFVVCFVCLYLGGWFG